MWSGEVTKKRKAGCYAQQLVYKKELCFSCVIGQERYSQSAALRSDGSWTLKGCFGFRVTEMKRVKAVEHPAGHKDLPGQICNSEHLPLGLGDRVPPDCSRLLWWEVAFHLQILEKTILCVPTGSDLKLIFKPSKRLWTKYGIFTLPGAMFSFCQLVLINCTTQMSTFQNL